VGVVSRGWGRTSRGAREVRADSTAAEAGDEPLLIKRRTRVPVWVGEDRAQAAAALKATYPNVQIIVSDDGLQHLALARDIEICVLDERGVGNGWLLPAGPLREPWPRRCDLILRDVPRELADYALDAQGVRHPLPVAGAVKAVAGIAKPERFFAMLEARGVKLAATEALPDHYAFDTPRPPEERRYTLLCTEKDAVKLWPLRPDALAVPLEVALDATTWKVLDALVDARLSSADGRSTA